MHSSLSKREINYWEVNYWEVKFQEVVPQVSMFKNQISILQNDWRINNATHNTEAERLN